MAKRFGRNQRRQMREEIAHAKDDARITRGQLVRSEQRVQAVSNEAAELRRRLEIWACDVMQLMGDDSAFNERVKLMTVDDRYADIGSLQLNPLIDLAPISPRDQPAQRMTAQTIITALIWRLNMSRDEFRPLIRIELENRFREPLGYALQQDHRWTERDIEYLARRIAREMGAYMRKAA